MMTFQPDPSTRCGTFAIVGRPNVGKSTLLNALVEEKLAIVSGKPQATRVPVVGIRTEDDAQLVFVDQPGLLDPEYLMHEAMRETAISWIHRADAVLYLHPAGPDAAPSIIDLVPDLGKTGPLALVNTKVDLRDATDAPRSEPLEAVFSVSALTGRGLDELLAWCRAHAPPGPFRHDAEDVSTQPMRFFVTEFIREAAFDLLHEELPYSLVAEVDEFRETTDPVYIRVTVFVERESQRRMVIGKGGRTVKQLGSGARAKIEALLGCTVYLDLWIKTLPKWRSDPALLARFGFATTDGRDT